MGDGGMPRTVALDGGARGRREFAGDEGSKTVRLGAKEVNMGSADGKTVPLVKKSLGIDPVVGWIVCVEGADRGRDYRLHTEKNSIGRSDAMDVAIKGDDSISRENHAYIVYNPKKNMFRVHPGDGRGLVYVNGDEVVTPVELAPHDIIEIGGGKFRFIPFCGKDFDWKGGDSVEDKS
jgi:hypothetical protein